MPSSLEEIRNIRIEKLNRLKALGINPFPSKSHKNIDHKSIISKFENYNKKEVIVAGRIMSLRVHGKLIFADLKDMGGVIQLYIKADKISKTNAKSQVLGFKDLNLIDTGDFVEAFGTVTKTERGQISILVKELKILSKAIRPLPEKWEGLKDPEEIFRRRYLDLVMSGKNMDIFLRKSKFWAVNRRFMTDLGFIEVETPILEHVTGGADAKPFITHHNALDEDFYLRISSELYQKRLIGGGFEKVFVLGPNFRNEGIDDEHLQEYYQLEWYWAYASYKDNMELVKEMFRHVARGVWETTKFKRKGYSFDLANKWEMVDYAESIKERLGVDVFADSEEKMMKILKKNKVSLSGVITRIRMVDNLWKLVRKEISGPAFLINIPKFISPLAKSKTENEAITERFQVLLAGSELGNGYSELNDPFDQLDRFKSQQSARDAGDEEAQMLDIDYVEMLEYGMPPASGYAHSERLFWFLEGVTAREGTLFPQMKRKIDSVTKSIYGLKEG